MTLEERVRYLENELTALQKASAAGAPNVYAAARQHCDVHFEKVKLEEQNYGALWNCESIARNAFREKHKVKGARVAPARYIQTEKDSAEYFELFKAFLTVYQDYLTKNAPQVKPHEASV